MSLSVGLDLTTTVSRRERARRHGTEKQRRKDDVNEKSRHFIRQLHMRIKDGPSPFRQTRSKQLNDQQANQTSDNRTRKVKSLQEAHASTERIPDKEQQTERAEHRHARNIYRSFFCQRNGSCRGLGTRRDQDGRNSTTYCNEELLHLRIFSLPDFRYPYLTSFFKSNIA